MQEVNRKNKTNAAHCKISLLLRNKKALQQISRDYENSFGAAITLKNPQVL